MEIKINVPVTERIQKSIKSDGEEFTLNRSNEYTWSTFISDSGESVEYGAELLFEAINNSDEFVREHAPSDVPNNLYFDRRNAEMSIMSNNMEVVYLAAAKYALELTKKNSTRSGYSIAKVLYWWATNEAGEFNRQKAKIESPDVSKISEELLQSLFFDHTPGHEIDEELIPNRDSHTKTRFDKEDMLPDR